MDIKIYGIQSDLYWEKKAENLDMFSRKIDAISGADLIVLPEMFNSGFTMNVEAIGETMDETTFHWMKNIAMKKDSVITGSFIVKEEGSYYNRMLWMTPEGSYEYYDKNHLFGMAKEDEFFTNGKIRKIVEFKSWRILLNVCYDLRFPEWSRNQDDYDCMINVASWPNKRANHWSTLLKARAIENQCYLIGINRYGMDGNDFYYSGNSVIINPNGEILEEANDEEKTINATISKQTLQETRTKLPFLEDRNPFSLI